MTYTLQMEFQTGLLKLTAHCTYRNNAGEIVANLSTPLTARGEQISNGYVISDTQKTETELGGKRCETELTSGTYLLMKYNHSLRLYASPDGFFELDPTK